MCSYGSLTTGIWSLRRQTRRSSPHPSRLPANWRNLDPHPSPTRPVWTQQSQWRQIPWILLPANVPARTLVDWTSILSMPWWLISDLLLLILKIIIINDPNKCSKGLPISHHLCLPCSSPVVSLQSQTDTHALDRFFLEKFFKMVVCRLTHHRSYYDCNNENEANNP